MPYMGTSDGFRRLGLPSGVTGIVVHHRGGVVKTYWFDGEVRIFGGAEGIFLVGDIDGGFGDRWHFRFTKISLHDIMVVRGDKGIYDIFGGRWSSGEVDDLIRDWAWKDETGFKGPRMRGAGKATIDAEGRSTWYHSTEKSAGGTASRDSTDGGPATASAAGASTPDKPEKPGCTDWESRGPRTEGRTCPGDEDGGFMTGSLDIDPIGGGGVIDPFSGVDVDYGYGRFSQLDTFWGWDGAGSDSGDAGDFDGDISFDPGFVDPVPIDADDPESGGGGDTISSGGIWWSPASNDTRFAGTSDPDPGDTSGSGDEDFGGPSWDPIGPHATAPTVVASGVSGARATPSKIR